MWHRGQEVRGLRSLEARAEGEGGYTEGGMPATSGVL